MEWMIAGAGLAALGLFILWRTSGWDLWGVLFESVWQLLRGKRTAKTPTAVEARLHEIGGAGTVAGKARRAASTVVAHFVAQVLGLLALVLVAVGVILIAVGFFAG